MLKTDKERIVDELAAELGSAETLIVADYRGLTNKQLEALRDQLLPHGARFRIVKNTLTRRAAEQAGAEALLVMLEGPTAIAFIESSGDPAAVAKALAATAKETNVLTMRGGILEGKPLSGDDVDQLATAAARRRAPRTARRCDRRATHAAARARLGAAARPARPHRRSHQAARRAGRSVASRSRRLAKRREQPSRVAEAAADIEEPAAEEEAADEGPAVAEPAEAGAPEDSASAESSAPENEEIEETERSRDSARGGRKWRLM